MSCHLFLWAETGHTVESPAWIAHSWISRSCAELPNQATIPTKWCNGQNPAQIPWPTATLHPSAVLQHPWISLSTSPSKAAALVQLHSSSSAVHPGNWSISAVTKSNTFLNSTHACSSASAQVLQCKLPQTLSFANGMNKEKHSHYDHGITRCRQYLLTEKGCPFLLEIKKKLLMLQTASPRPLIMSVKILIISH